MKVIIAYFILLLNTIDAFYATKPHLNHLKGRHNT